jgi:hypothetical protein
MFDTMKKTLAVCTAAGLFGVGAWTGVSGIDQISTSKVRAIAADETSVARSRTVVDTYLDSLNARTDAAVAATTAKK